MAEYVPVVLTLDVYVLAEPDVILTDEASHARVITLAVERGRAHVVADVDFAGSGDSDIARVRVVRNVTFERCAFDHAEFLPHGGVQVEASELVDGNGGQFVARTEIVRNKRHGTVTLRSIILRNSIRDMHVQRNQTRGDDELTVVPNHYGYGLRKDEEPFAHKIPPGGNWKDLPRDDQIAFMKGALGSGGGQTMYLRRLSWDEPALTMLAAPMAKATCQLHPGPLSERREYMTFNPIPQQPRHNLTIAELFAGGGLMGIGLRAAGFRIIWANDFDKNACRAYATNIGDHIVHGDITTIDPADIPDTDVIAGGPPCQDYSVAGTGAGENGERGKLVWAYLRIIEAKRPKAFIFENVKGLITRKHRPTFDVLLAKFEEIGYRVNWRLINAWDYGVAQKRERVFIVGIREDLGFTFEFPEPSPEDYRTKVLRDVIGDLPEPVDTCGRNVKKAERIADMNEPGPTVTTQFRCQTVEVTNHNPQPLSEKAMEYLQRDPRHLQKHRPPTVDEPSPTLPAVLHKGVPYGLFYPNHGPGSFWTPKSEYTYDQANRVQSMDAPCNTIPAHHNSGQPIHPTQAPRRFTVRECLRIQSVPDWYVLPDDLSLSAQYRIVGNGVASRVAYLLGIALAEQLRAATESSVIGERLIPGTGTPDGRGTANSREEAV